MTQFAYTLSGDTLPALPDDSPMPNLPPPSMAPGQQFGMNGGPRPASGIPKFVMIPVKTPNGYINVEYVDIITPGDPKAMPRRKVTEGVIAQYPDYYAHWKRGLTMAPEGTPLEMWPVMTPAMVHQLKANNIFTVEQLATVADNNLMHIPFGKTLRNQAKTWLESKKDSDALERAAAQQQAMQDGMRMMETRFDQEKAEMKAENAGLKKQLDAILARLGAPETAPVVPQGFSAAETAPETPKRPVGRPRASEAA